MGTNKDGSRWTPENRKYQQVMPPEGRKFKDWYIVTPDGRVYSIRRWRFLTLHKNNVDYRQVWITAEGEKSRWYKVHRLVAHFYVPMPARLQDHPNPEVNHKDGKKDNNHYTNLEWNTHAENIQHSFDVLGRKMPSGDAHWNKGKKASAETRAKQGAKKKGENHPKFQGWYLHDGKRYTSSAELAQVLGISSTEVCRRRHRGEIEFEPFFRQAA